MKPRPKISDAEWKVVKLLWEKSPQTANEIVKTLSEITDWKPKTIKTLLNRLCQKQAIGFKRVGREYHYFPRVDKDQYVHAESRSFLNRVFDGALKPMLAALIENDDLSADDISELKEILNQKK